MKFGIHTLDAFSVRGKTVLCRVDINQPVDREKRKLKSTARIEACVPTIRELSQRGARLVLLAHQGSDIEYKNFYTLRPHAAVLERLLERPVDFIDDVTGPAARAKICALRDGDILLLDNVRFCSEEQTLFELKLRLSHEQQAPDGSRAQNWPRLPISMCATPSPPRTATSRRCAALNRCCPAPWGGCLKRNTASFQRLCPTPRAPAFLCWAAQKSPTPSK